MDDKDREDMERIRRSVTSEMVILEDDFDMARNAKQRIVSKLMGSIDNLQILNDSNAVTDETDTALRVVTTTLKALESLEKAAATAVGVKLRNKELDMASAAESKNRIAVILQSVAPSKIEGTFPTESLEDHLASMFDSTIKESELRTNPKDLTD